jgi:sterol desaturase/sphingolipid hydroxylase (fatty acid hydroxylase superfamily)
MATEVARFAAGWALFVAWAIVAFTALEAVFARRRVRPRAGRIAAAAALLAVDAAVTRWLTFAPPAAGLARAVVAWLLAEVASYWVHRAQHRVPLLWRFHRLHHDEPLAWHVAWRSHPVDAAAFTLAIAGASWLAGAPALAAAGFVIARRAWTIVLHADVAWPASPLDRAIATPCFHHRHHREDLAPANFASSLPVLDTLFGTWAH